MRVRSRILCISLATAVGWPVFADVVWPASIIRQGLYSWPAILIGLLVEFIFLWVGLKFSPAKAFVADLCMNAFSAAIGYVLLYMGFNALDAIIATWLGKAHLAIGFVLVWALVDTVLTFVAVVGVTAFLELLVLRVLFRVPVNRQNVAILILANITSILLACIGALIGK